LRFRSPLLSQSRFLSFPPGTEMVHFPGFARARLWIHRAVRGFYPRGFPHSEIPGSMPACGSPRLIAACHVLHRLLLPRHPPCALSSLTIKFTRHTAASLRSILTHAVIPSAASVREANRIDAESRDLEFVFDFGKTTTRRANSMGLDPAHRTQHRFSFVNLRALCG
jgi:hypothetical protein